MGRRGDACQLCVVFWVFVMIGSIDVGGGMRGIYGAGVYDWCMDNDVRFDYVFGVSAGSANASSYVSGQRGRNYRFYMEYARRSQYMGLWQKVTTGNFINLDYIYSTLSNSDGEDPLDFEAMMDSPQKMCVVAADAETGKPRYFYKDDFKKDDYSIISASCCVPWVNKPYMYKSHGYYDGGIANPIPVDKAFEEGCDKVVLILTRPRNYYRKPKKDRAAAKAMRKQYPRAAKALAGRAHLYNRQLDLAKRYEEEGRVLIVAPDSIEGMKTLTTDKKAQDLLYQKGYMDASAILDFISA